MGSLMLEVGREVRGYSLALLAVTVAGVSVLDRRSPALFGLASFVAVGTHLHAAIPVAALMVYVAVAGFFDRRWRLSVMAAALASVLVYVGTLADSGRGGVRRFRPEFPLETLWELLGRNPASVLGLGGMAVAGLVAVRGWRRDLWVLPAVPTAALGGAWVVAPFDLYPRFIYWAIPALGLAVGLAVSRYPATLAVVVVVAAVNVVPRIPDMGVDELPNRALVQAAGPRPCVIGGLPEYMSWYGTEVFVGNTCDRGIVPPLFYPATFAAEARATWPVLCEAIRGGEVRARSQDACP